MDISRRKSRILQEIVALYTLYGDPVGSRLLEEMLAEFSVSSATIRNEMAEMTALGLLAQPHTSAGRVPTMIGYRYYVEKLLRPAPLTEQEQQIIHSATDDMDPDPDKAAGMSARLLAKLTGLAAIAATPRGGNLQITRFELLCTGKYNLAVAGLTSIGGARIRVCRLARELSEAQRAMVSEVLNSHLAFVSAEDVTPRRLAAINQQFGDQAALYRPVIAAAAEIIEGIAESSVYVEGQQHLLSFPELDTSLKDLLELFADGEALARRLEIGDQLRIEVGEALGIEHLGLVAGRYHAAGGRHGVMAVVGPMRMDYGFVMPRLRYLSEQVSQALTNPGA